MAWAKKKKKLATRKLLKIDGYVWCDRHGEIHDDTCDPYAYGEPERGYEDQRCQPTDHRRVYARLGGR